MSIFLESHFKWIVIVFCLSVILAPVVIWMCYSILPPLLPIAFSADGLLGFGGAILGACASILVGIIALYQSQKATDLSEELDITKRRNEIRPCLLVFVKRIEVDLFEIKINNLSNHPAIGVYLFDVPFVPVIKGNEMKVKTFSFGKCKKSDLIISDSWKEESSNENIETVTLIYFDSDNNLINHDFRYIGNDAPYESKELEYM